MREALRVGCVDNWSALSWYTAHARRSLICCTRGEREAMSSQGDPHMKDYFMLDENLDPDQMEKEMRRLKSHVQNHTYYVLILQLKEVSQHVDCVLQLLHTFEDFSTDGYGVLMFDQASSRTPYCYQKFCLSSVVLAIPSADTFVYSPRRDDADRIHSWLMGQGYLVQEEHELESQHSSCGSFHDPNMIEERLDLGRLEFDDLLKQIADDVNC